MEAEYVAYYLGCSMLSKGTTGLGVIQKPLREKYFAFRKSAENKMGPEVGIRINPSGLILVFPGAHPGQENEEFYELPSIHFIEAVHFVTMKQKDKKHYGAFVPIDESGAKNASQDKLFVQIEKKSNHLTKISHPAMLACVMRRPTGVKAVDCHMFVVPVVEDALRIADMVHSFQDRPINPDYSHFVPGQPPGRNDRYSNPDVVPRDFGPRDPGKRESAEEYALYRGPGRGLELKQDHFRKSNDYDDRRPEDLNPESNRSFERERQFNSRPEYDRGPDDRYRNEYDDRNRFLGGLRSQDPDRGPFVDRRSREYKAGSGGYIERDSFGQEFEFDNAVVHERQRSGGEPDKLRTGSDKSGGLSPRNEFSGRIERNSADFPPQNRYPERPPAENGRPPWQGGRAGSGFRDEPPPSQQQQQQRNIHGEQPPYSRPRGGRTPPRAQSPPRGNLSPRARSPTAEDDNIYSASNLESRQEAEVAPGKPIAKVPPHRHAGIRVLPSIPIPGLKNQLKHVAPRPGDAPGKDLKEEKAPAYNFDVQNESDDDNPYDNVPVNHIPYNNSRHDRALSDRSPQVEIRGGDGPRNNANRVKSDGYNYADNRYHSNDKTYGNRPTTAEQNSSGKQWSYEGEKDKFLKREKESVFTTGYKSQSAQDFHDPGYQTEYNRGQHNAKDAEIADMFSNLRTGNAVREVDFERSLGYLP